jgi:hypothetical protein
VWVNGNAVPVFHPATHTTRKNFSLSRATVLVNLMMMLLHFLIFSSFNHSSSFPSSREGLSLCSPTKHGGKLFAYGNELSGIVQFATQQDSQIMHDKCFRTARKKVFWPKVSLNENKFSGLRSRLAGRKFSSHPPRGLSMQSTMPARLLGVCVSVMASLEQNESDFRAFAISLVRNLFVSAKREK